MIKSLSNDAQQTEKKKQKKVSITLITRHTLQSTSYSKVSRCFQGLHWISYNGKFYS